MSLLYNLFIISLLVSWFKRDFVKKKVRGFNISNNLFLIVTILLIVVITLFNIELLDSSDVDNAILQGSASLWNGVNPYVERVIEHILPSGREVFHVYNYFPVTLFYYSLFYPFFKGSLFIPFSNLFLTPFIFYFTNELIELNLKKICFLLIIIATFLFNNALLMLFFFVIGEFFREKRNKLLSVICYSLSALVKYATGLFLLVMFLEDLRKRRSFRLYFIPFLTFLLISFPFGVVNVLSGAVVYQVLPSHRSVLAMTEGPLLLEVLKFFNAESLIVILSPLIIIFLYFLDDSVFYENTITLTLFLMLLLPFYGTELLIIPLFQILVWFYKEETFLRLSF